VEHKLLEGCPSLWDDQQADRRAVGDEGFLDGPTAGDQLLVRTESLGRWQGRS